MKSTDIQKGKIKGKPMDFVRQRYRFNMMSRQDKQTLAGRLRKTVRYFHEKDRIENKIEIVDHRRSKNQLVRFPVSCDWTPATDELGALLSDPPPPPRSGFAILEPPKLKPPPPSIVGRPRVEPCFAASSLSLTAVSCASNLWEGLVSHGFHLE